MVPSPERRQRIGVPEPDPVAMQVEADQLVRRALAEDLDVEGDITTNAVVRADATGLAELVVRSDGVVAGLGLVATVFDQVDPRISVVVEVEDGERVRRGQSIARVAGPLRSIITGERTALNLVSYLSGIASTTRRYVDALEGTGCAVRDTRKTIPGTRLLAKAAVRAGGGVNHRVGLFDAMLVKDNHVAAAGGVYEATRLALARAAGHHVQVEVDDLQELDEAIAAGARDVMLDNFDVDLARTAVARGRELEEDHGPIVVEASGRIDLATARRYAEVGVDRIAIGALTHSAPQLDVGLDIRAARQGRSDPGDDAATGA
jgi:nicotinate-nucleotide pyrophosphorylase (carboxylating)